MLKKLDDWLVWLEQSGLERIARKAGVALQLRVHAILLDVWMRVPMLREQYERQNAVIERQNAVIERQKQTIKTQDSQINRTLELAIRQMDKINQMSQQLNHFKLLSTRDSDLTAKLVQCLNDHAAELRAKTEPPAGGAP